MRDTIQTMRILGFFVMSFTAAAAASAADIHPIVEAESGFLFGTHLEGKWLDAGKTAKLMKPGTEFRLYSLTAEAGSAKGGKPESSGEPCPDTVMVPLDPKPRKAAVGIAAPWNALPRVPRVTATTQPVYIKAARDFLTSRGLQDPQVKLTQVLRVDLDGDGEEEVLLSATNYRTSDASGGIHSSASAGDYSFVLLRRVVKGKVRTQLIEGEFYPEAKVFNAPNRYRVDAVLDLDGDGTLEVIVGAAYYEGRWTTIYGCAPDKIEELLATGCGA